MLSNNVIRLGMDVVGKLVERKPKGSVLVFFVLGLALATATFFFAGTVWSSTSTKKEVGRVEPSQAIIDDADAVIASTNDPGRIASALMRKCFAEIKRGRAEHAYTYFGVACQTHPRRFSETIEAVDFAKFFYLRGQVLGSKEIFDQIVGAEPGVSLPYRSYAFLLATSPFEEFRDSKLAVKLARRGVELASKTEKSEALEVLAAALAEDGEFAEAVDVQKEAMKGLEALSSASASALAGDYAGQFRSLQVAMIEQVASSSAEDGGVRLSKMRYALRLYEGKVPLRVWPQ